jgi:hypothetical protein
MSGVSQNQPVKVEIKGFKTSHFSEQKTAPRDCPDAGPMGHVERPQSEPSGNDGLGFLGEQLAHQIEDRAVKDDKAGLERFQTDGLDQMALADARRPH